MKTITHNGKEYTFGNVVVNGVSREITDDEGVIYAEMNEASVVHGEAFATKIAKKEVDLAAAKSKLEGLGLTADEVKEVFGLD